MKASSIVKPCSSTSSCAASSQTSWSASPYSYAVACGSQRSASSGHRPRRLLPLQQVEADVHLAGDLDAGEADLAVAHRGVHVADGEHAAGLPDREEDARALAVPVVVEVAAVPARRARSRAPRRRSRRRRRRPSASRGTRSRSFIRITPVLHLEHPRERLLHLVDQLPEAGDERRDAPFDRPHVEDLRDQRVAGLRARDRDRAGGAVDPRHVDPGDEVVLAPDLAREAVVRLERHHFAGLDLQHRDEVRPERPDRPRPAEMRCGHVATLPSRPRRRPAPCHAAARAA